MARPEVPRRPQGRRELLSPESCVRLGPSFAHGTPDAVCQGVFQLSKEPLHVSK